MFEGILFVFIRLASRVASSKSGVSALSRAFTLLAVILPLSLTGIGEQSVIASVFLNVFF